MSYTKPILVALTVATLSMNASAGVTTTFRDTLDTLFFPGTGNSNTDYTVAHVLEESGAFNGNTIELGLKAKQRFFGQTNVGGSGNVYTVQPGFAPTSGAGGAPDSTNRSWWNFDFSIDYGDREVSDTLVTLTIQDIDGDILNIPFAEIPIAFPGDTDLVQNSWNTGFGFINDPLEGTGNFDPSKLGDYIISLTAVDISSGDVLGSVSIVARVIPMPTPAALAGAGLFGIAGMRRRR